METDLKQYKRPFSSVAKDLKSLFRMLIPSKSKAQTSYYGTRSAGTVDYRHGADVRLLKRFKSNGNEVLKKKEHYVLEAKRPLVIR